MGSVTENGLTRDICVIVLVYMKMGVMMIAERDQAVRATMEAMSGVLYLVALIG